MSSESIQQSLLDEAEHIEETESDKQYRQHAFRVAFDFLEQHTPLQNTEEYWLKICEDVAIVSADNIENGLCQELLSAVICYLSNGRKEYVCQ